MRSVVPPKRDVFWFITPMNTSSIYWLVVLTILKNMKVNGKDYSGRNV